MIACPSLRRRQELLDGRYWCALQDRDQAALFTVRVLTSKQLIVLTEPLRYRDGYPFTD
jgi:hypothetical protein